MELKNIPTVSIQPNAYNPNVVPDDIMVQLKKSIQRDGFLQPIIVRPAKEDGKYEIIDGAHRYQVMTDLGKAEIPCLIIEKDDNLAKVSTINMNKLRGEFDTIKLAEVLVDLKKTYTDEQLHDLLGYTPEVIKSYTEVLDFDFKKFEAEKDTEVKDFDIKEDAIELTNDFTAQLTLIQLDIVETALAAKGPNRVDALVNLCRDYLTTTHPDKYKEVVVRAEEMKKPPAPLSVEPLPDGIEEEIELGE